MNIQQLQETIDCTIKEVWTENIPNDYRSYYLLMEDSLKNALYFHLRTKLRNLLDSNNIRIYPEYHYKNCKADLAIVKLNDKPGENDHLKEDVQSVLSIIEIKYKSGNNVKHFENDVQKIKKYIDANPKDYTKYYLAFVHEAVYEFIEEDSWLTLKQKKWAKGRLTELSGYYIEDQNEMSWQVLSHNDLNPDFQKGRRREKKLFNIGTVLEILSGKRPLFRSEKDFQESLIQTIRSMDMNCEANKVINGTKVDIWIENGEEEILIQLKHKTKKLSVNVVGSQFDLKTHGAQDQGRYDFLKDLKSLELLCIDNPLRTGYAILLTNDHRYWEKPMKHDSVDKDFHLNEGRIVNGTLAWKDETSYGTKSGREVPIAIKGTYDCKWSNYSRFSSHDCEFFYLCVEI